MGDEQIESVLRQTASAAFYILFFGLIGIMAYRR